MRTFFEFMLAVLGAAALIYFFQQPAVLHTLRQTPSATVEPLPAILITTAKSLRLRELPTLEGTNCRCYLQRGDRLEFLQTVSSQTYKVPGKNGFVYDDPLYKVRVRQSINVKCAGQEGWVFGGYVAWEPLYVGLKKKAS